MRPVLLLVALTQPCLAQDGPGQTARSLVEPAFSIWDVELGAPVATLPEIDVNDIACGTGGGPIGAPLAAFDDFRDCRPEPSGLREVRFAYDDEMDYVARALDIEFEALRSGTSVFAHQVEISVLIDDAGTIQGLRILTDPRVPQRERRRAVTLMRNFQARYDGWGLDCTDLPLADGEMAVGEAFTKKVCEGVDPAGTLALRLDSRYLRKRGQAAVNLETREVNSEYFESFTRLEMVRLPYATTPPPVLR